MSLQHHLQPLLFLYLGKVGYELLTSSVLAHVLGDIQGVLGTSTLQAVFFLLIKALETRT